MKMIEVCRCTIYRLVNLSNIDSHTFYGAALTHTLTQDLLINKKKPRQEDTDSYVTCALCLYHETFDIAHT
jgi:hypothetical protein